MKIYQCDYCAQEYISGAAAQRCATGHQQPNAVAVFEYDEPTASTRRTPAVEDFAAIGQRLRELQPAVKGYSEVSPTPATASQGGPAGGAVNYLPDDLSDISQIPISSGGGRTPNDDAIRIANVYNCRERTINYNGCYFNASKVCLINGKCMKP